MDSFFMRVVFFAALPLLLLAEAEPELSAADLQSSFLAGFNAYRAGDIEAAHEAFSACAPYRADCMTNLASVLLDIDPEHASTAETLYRSVLDVEEEGSSIATDAAFNLALLLEDRAKHDADAASEAVRLYTAVTEAQPERWDAWGNLGAAAAAHPADDSLLVPRAYQRAIVLLERSHFEGSSGDEVPVEEPLYLARMYYGLAMALLQMTGAQCAAFAKEGGTLLLGVEEDGSLTEGGGPVTEAVCFENAQNALRTTLDIEPTHVQAEHMLAATLAEAPGQPDPEAGRGRRLSKASPAFVTALFDDFADTFDSQLAALKYAVPELLGAAARRHVAARRGGRPYTSALDAGCGTGLAGLHLRPLVSGPLLGVRPTAGAFHGNLPPHGVARFTSDGGPFAQVDLSPKMLERAARLRVDGPSSPARVQIGAIGTAEFGGGGSAEAGGDGEANGFAPVYDDLFAKDLLEMRLPKIGEVGEVGEVGHRVAGGVELITAADVLV